MSASTSGPDLRAAFHLTDLPSLSRSTADRSEQLRTDETHRAATWPTARVVRVDPFGRSPLEPTGDGALRLVTQPSSAFGPSVPEGAVLLGEEDGVAFWALRVPDPDAGNEANDAGSGFPADSADGWSDLRISGAELDARSAGLMTTAVALLNWNERTVFCARDGSPTHVIKAGWARLCAAAGHEEYPRTDPSMICLVHDGGDRVLLARQPVWPAGRYSVLAGFVEAGESLEACVARECAEEVGITVHTISYLGSQPWPFPRSLMIGFEAVADPDESLRLQEGEIDNARWVTRDELRTALARGHWMTREGAHGVGGTAFESGNSDDRHELVLPGGVSIARAMLEAWAGA